MFSFIVGTVVFLNSFYSGDLIFFGVLVWCILYQSTAVGHSRARRCI